jgi:hypothetical protein
MPGWFRRQREAAWLAQADAETLMFTKGGNAYAEARRRERISLLRLPDYASTSASFRRR